MEMGYLGFFEYVSFVFHVCRFSEIICVLFTLFGYFMIAPCIKKKIPIYINIRVFLSV